jgi:geranylgeranyl pyrophosphate synthase
MRSRFFQLALVMLGWWLTTGMAASGNSTDLSQPSGLLLQLSEAGGPTLAVLLAVYWMRDSERQRIQESQRYSEALQDHKEELQRLHERSLADSQRYAQALENLVQQSLHNVGKEVPL